MIRLAKNTIEALLILIILCTVLAGCPPRKPEPVLAPAAAYELEDAPHKHSLRYDRSKDAEAALIHGAFRIEA